MIKTFLGLLGVPVTLFIFFALGSLLQGSRNHFSASKSVLGGFFLYYILFDLFCLPVMLHYRPLSLLTALWIPSCLLIALFALILRRKVLIGYLSDLKSRVSNSWVVCLWIFFIVLLQIAIVTAAYQFTFDAAYYVANATTSIATDSINIYDPYTGEWQDHFEFRYLFATYPINDAVICQFTGIHPLVWTKTTMSSVAIILANLVLFRIACCLFSVESQKNDSGADTEAADRYALIKSAVFLSFGGIINFFFITIFTSSAFLVTRSYEGKSLLGNVILPTIFLIYLKMAKQGMGRGHWLSLALVSLGSTAISNSSNMLVPAAVMIFCASLSLQYRKISPLIKGVLCTVPCLALMLAYVFYVRGAFVIHTYPG